MHGVGESQLEVEVQAQVLCIKWNESKILPVHKRGQSHGRRYIEASQNLIVLKEQMYLYCDALLCYAMLRMPSYPLLCYAMLCHAKINQAPARA
jgi:hypothetical protein